jgi:hypothetical protein
MKRNKLPGETESIADTPHPAETLLTHLAADSEPSDAAREAAWARGTREALQSQLAALRRQHTPSRSTSTTRKLAIISPEIQGLDRPALLRRLTNLSRLPGVQIAHLELARLSDDDLRRMVAEVENTETTNPSA